MVSLPGVVTVDGSLKHFTFRIGQLTEASEQALHELESEPEPVVKPAHNGTSEFQSPWSCAGMPVVSIPCGLASDGMPGAIQLVGPYHAEPRLLAIAAWCEARIGFDNVPPGV